MFFTLKKSKASARRPGLLSAKDDYTFRRSRTLTGSTSPKIAAGAQANSRLKTPRLQEHELRQQHNRVGKTLVMTLLCVGFLGWLLANYIGNFTINYIQPVKNASPATAIYQSSLEKYMAGHPFERFGFMLSEMQVEEFMRQEHTEIAAFTISRAWYGGNVRFNVSFRQPLLTWQVGTERFYVDSQGIGFGYDHFKGHYVAVTDQSGISPDAEASVASKRFLLFLGKLVGAFNAGGKGKVSNIIIPDSTREIQLKLEGRDTLIKTHIDRDPLQQAEDSINVLQYFDNKKIKPAYVDVRVGGRAFYQ